MTGLGDLVPRDMQMKALKKIYDFNVMKFANGEMGAINGIDPDGKLITTNEQVQEVWTGTTFSLAALMLSDGLKDEGYRTAWGGITRSTKPKVIGSGARRLGSKTATTVLRCICARRQSGPWR